MPDSYITPAGTTYLGQSKYTVNDADQMTVDVALSITIADAVKFKLTYPNAATPSGEVVKGGQSVSLSTTPGSPNITDRRVTITTTPGATDTVMEVTIETTAPAPLNEAWTVRVRGLAKNQCALELTDGTFTVTRVLCDAHANFSGTPASAGEGTTLILSAGPAVKQGSGAVVAADKVNVIGSPAPKERYRWEYKSGPVTLGGDLPAVTETTTTPVSLPGSMIFQLSPVVNFSLKAWLSVDPGEAPLTAASTPRPVDLPADAVPAAVTISHRPQKLMVVLDRTGSMLGDKWANATTTARIMTDLFSAIRAGNPNDQVGILEFDDAYCDWHDDSKLSPTTKEVFALTDVSTAWATICAQNLGSPGDCTNIGDALYVAYNRLTASPVAQVRYAVVLITDGLENAGHRRISTQTIVGSKPVIDYAAPDDLVISSIGIGSGSEVNTQALSDIAGAHVFHLVPPGVTDVKTLKAAATQSVAQLFGANGLTVTTAPSKGNAASAPANAGFFVVNGGEHRLAFAVETVAAADTVEVYRALTGENFQPVSLGSLQTQSCPTHFFAYVDLPGLLGANEGSDTEWAIVLKHTPPVSDIESRLLAWVDLRARADHVFDKQSYGTGEPMRVTVRLRDGHKPITGARVSVVMKRPKRSLGDFLARNSGRVTIGDGGIAVTTATHGDGRKTFGDTSPKFSLYEAILQARGEVDIGWEEPPGIFADGTNELHELAGTGNYSNVYAHTDKEGAVSFRFYVDGTLDDGSAFSRVVLASKFVGVKIDPILSSFTIAYGVTAPPGYQAVTVSFKPQDRFGNLLGPFHEAELNFVATSGTWSSDVVGDLDGTYHRTLLYRKEDGVPVVTVETQGTSTVPLPVSRGCLSLLLRPLLWLLALILRILSRS